MTTPSGIPDPDPIYNDSNRYHREQNDLLKKIAGLLTLLALLALTSVILQVVGLITANNTADEVSDRLDDIRQNTAALTP
jgi:hypothetical protein